MHKQEEIEDIDRALKLLEEYTDRTKKMYREISGEKRQRLMLLYIIIVSILGFASTGILFFKEFFKIKGEDISVISVYTGFMAIFFSIAFMYIQRKKDTAVPQKEDLRIYTRQLKALLSLVSQYSEHNNLVLSEIRKFEVRLRLVEAEEVVLMVEKEYLYTTDKYENKLY